MRIGGGQRPLRRRWRGWGRTSLLALLGLTATVLALIAVCPIALWVENTGEPAVTAHTRGRDALWLGHAWVDGRKSQTDVAALAKQLSDGNIRDLFVHTGPLSDDGSLGRELSPRASWFVAAMHRTLPGVQVQSWLGDMVAPAYDALHMADRATRDRVAASVTQMLDLGFDGVHFDLEPVRSGSPDYLTLLDRTRPITASRHAVLSVSTPQLEPLPGAHHVGAILTGNGKYWSQTYFAEVASKVDQLAVMSYDTWMPTRSLYSGYVARQTTMALEVTPPQVDLLMGVPAFRADGIGHHATAETVAAAVRGIRLGLSRAAPDRRQFGAALYVDFAATANDWSDYRRDWCT